LEYKNIPPKEFDNICKEYMAKDAKSVELLDTKDFEKKSEDGIVLYRGVSEKQFADNFKNGIVYFPSSTCNVRGIGIYTTTSLECAKQCSDKSNPKTIIKMLIPKTGLKNLKNKYLEKLKEIIRHKHPEEFGMFSEGNKENFIFDSASKLLKEKFDEAFEKIQKEQIEDPDEQDRILNEAEEKIRKDPIIANRKRYFKENKASVFYNSGLLTKLLEFDALHSIDYLSSNIKYKEE